jgi:hypothetical protein
MGRRAKHFKALRKRAKQIRSRPTMDELMEEGRRAYHTPPGDRHQHERVNPHPSGSDDSYVQFMYEERAADLQWENSQAQAEAKRKRYKRENPTTLVGQFNKWGTNPGQPGWHTVLWFAAIIALVAIAMNW